MAGLWHVGLGAWLVMVVWTLVQGQLPLDTVDLRQGLLRLVNFRISRAFTFPFALRLKPMKGPHELMARKGCLATSPDQRRSKHWSTFSSLSGYL